MRGVVLLAGLAVFLFYVSNVSASSGCSVSAFNTACSSCSFSSSGEIDKQCKDGYEQTGKTCLMAAYPVAAAQYAGGDCPEIDACISVFNSCRGGNCPGTDKEDCTDAKCMTCYTKGDECLNEAAAKCTEEAYERNPIFSICPCFGGLLPLFMASIATAAGAPIIFKKR